MSQQIQYEISGNRAVAFEEPFGDYQHQGATLHVVPELPETITHEQHASHTVLSKTLEVAFGHEVELISHRADDNDTPKHEALAYAVNELPEFKFVARRARQMAESIRDQRMELLREGDFEAVPMPIDMTGTARRVIEAERQDGQSSAEAQSWRAALLGDTERQVAEATSKMTWGYFKPLVHTFDRDEGVFKAFGHSVRQITENGISPMTEAEDTERSINDFTAELLDEAFIQSLYANDYIVLTISECADWAITDYETDASQGQANKAYGGYVPEIEKRMIRASHFNTEKQERYVEQVALPGTAIEMDDIVDSLRVLGVVAPGQQLSKQELHGMRIMVPKDVIGSVLDFVALADSVASERTGEQLFMGEITGETTLDYSDIPSESDRRNEAYAGVAEQVAEKMLQLERDGVDKWQTEIHVSNFLKQSLMNIVKAQPEQARLIFDEATATGLQRVQAYERAGQFDQARLLEADVFARAPAPSSCGAGSCGLEKVSTLNGNDLAAAKRLGIKSEEMSDKMVSFNKAYCKGCEGITKVYYNAANGDATCASCMSTKIGNRIDQKNHKSPKKKSLFDFSA